MSSLFTIAYHKSCPLLYSKIKLNLISNVVLIRGQSIDWQVVDWMIYHLIKMLLLLDAVKAIDPQQIIAQMHYL